MTRFAPARWVLASTFLYASPFYASAAYSSSQGATMDQQSNTHHTSGSFVPEVKPAAASQADPSEAATLGRFILSKTLHGGIEGTGTGQMLTSVTATKGSAAYVAIEIITGKVDGRGGSFALVHKGLMERGAQSLVVTMVPDSGTGDLAGLAGTFIIHISPEGKHTYDFDYTLPAAQ